MEGSRTVRQVLQNKPRGVLTVSPDDSVFDALQTMAEKNIGALVVVRGEEVVGIFSERDYARKVILVGKASKQTPVAEIMTTPVITVSAAQSVRDCMQLMTDERVRHLPVLEDGRLIGVISIGDVVKDIISEQEHVIEQLQTYITGGSY